MDLDKHTHSTINQSMTTDSRAFPPCRFHQLSTETVLCSVDKGLSGQNSCNQLLLIDWFILLHSSRSIQHMLITYILMGLHYSHIRISLQAVLNEYMSINWLILLHSSRSIQHMLITYVYISTMAHLVWNEQRLVTDIERGMCILR